MKMIWLLVIYFWAFFHTASSESHVIELTDEQTTVSWRPTDNTSIILQAAAGYQIQVDSSDIDINGQNGDHVTLKSLSNDGDESSAIMFSYTVTPKQSYLYNSNRVQADYVGTNESNRFIFNFTRVGEPATTTTEHIPSSTPEPFPTAEPEIPSTLVVFLTGKAAKDFDSAEIGKLKNAIARMGIDYCGIQNCPLNGTITQNNVQIVLLEECPMLWENYENCVSLTFSLPIVKLESQNNPMWDGYQLSTSHLTAMWQTYAKQYLGEIGLNLYSAPNVNNIFKFRLLATGLVLGTLVVVILLVRHIMKKVTKRRRKLSDTISIMDQASNRTSQLSLTPHYLQELPPLFANDSPLYIDQRNQRTYNEYSGFVDEMEGPAHPAPTKMNIMDDGQEETKDAEA